MFDHELEKINKMTHSINNITNVLFDRIEKHISVSGQYKKSKDPVFLYLNEYKREMIAEISKIAFDSHFRYAELMRECVSEAKKNQK